MAGARQNAAFVVGVAVALLATRAAPALAKTGGAGDAPFFRPATFRATAFRPLASLGPDAIRVTYGSIRGQWSVELRGTGTRFQGAIAEFDARHGPIRVGSWLRLGGPRQVYDAISSGIDQIVARRAPASPPETPGSRGVTELIVCTDGATYTVERRLHDRTRWTRLSTCDDADADAIAQLLVKYLPRLECLVEGSDGLPEHCVGPPSDGAN